MPAVDGMLFAAKGRGWRIRLGRRGVGLLVVMALLAVADTAVSQTTAASSTENRPASSDPQTPAYEVATIKAPRPDQFGGPLRAYIQGAFGLPVNATGLVLGPEWVSTARYVINAKPSESLQTAMQAMSAEERSRTVHLMMQGLLADRFQFKAHLETREMPVYHLTVAKGGPKLKENPDVSKKSIGVAATGVKAFASSMRDLANMLPSVPEIGGRMVIDDTGLTGTYDILLHWSPMGAAATDGGDAESVSLFTAIEEQLGLKLTVTKGPVQVVVIDHIEKPSEN